MRSKGKLFVISGPSGVGKGTVCRELLRRNENISVSVSATTRKPRSEDTEGVTYFFKTPESFRQMIEHGELLEWAEYNGNYYGTPAMAVEEKLNLGTDVILEIEAQGAMKVMAAKPDAVSIFIAPPDIDTLYTRLRGRGSETAEEIERRVETAKWELEQMDKYNYIVVNDNLDDAIALVEEIMKNEREKI